MTEEQLQSEIPGHVANGKRNEFQDSCKGKTEQDIMAVFDSDAKV